MKGVISIHCFILYNIPIINELQLLDDAISITSTYQTFIIRKNKLIEVLLKSPKQTTEIKNITNSCKLSEGCDFIAGI